MGLVLHSERSFCEQDDQMKALSIQWPYTEAILRGEKQIEYRSWSTNYRGDLLIVSSARASDIGGFGTPTREDLGHAICVVELYDIKSNGGEFEWYLRRVRPIRRFPVKGRLGLYNIDDSWIRLDK